MYLKTLGLHVYFDITKKSYSNDSKHIEANALALMALRSTLNKEYLCLVSLCDSAFAVWNTLTSPALQKTNHVEMELVEENPNNIAIWSKGMTPLR